MSSFIFSLVPRWKMIAWVQKSLNLFPDPLGYYLHSGLKRIAERGRAPNLYSIGSTIKMVKMLQDDAAFSVCGKVCLEIGTGWSLASAILLSVLGVKEIYTIDVVRHLRSDYVKSALEQIKALSSNHSPLKVDETGHTHGIENVAGALPESDMTSQGNKEPLITIDSLVTMPLREEETCENTVLATRSIHYMAPIDSCQVPLPGSSADLIYSLAVLEHVPKAEIASFVREQRRLIKPNGLVYHYIQPVDHSVNRDAKATGVDFLEYASKHWDRYYQNRFQHQNRMRLPEYLLLFQQTGFEVLSLERYISPRSLQALTTMRIAEEFYPFKPADLATTYFWVILKPV